MNKYELMYILNPNTEEAQREALLEKFKGIIEADGSVLTLLKSGACGSLPMKFRRKKRAFTYW